MLKDALDVFISYAHRDESLRAEFEEHLALLMREGEIRPWHDRRISAGDEWRGQIDYRLEAADLILLLISASFIDSDYCFDIETMRALERHATGEARVIPVILRPCDWTIGPFAQLQALPRDGKAVTLWQNRDAAWLDVVRGLRLEIATLGGDRDEPPGRRKEWQPRYADAESRRLSRRLKTLFRRRKALTLAGDDMVAVDSEILHVRRLLRKGPQLLPGEFLGDGRYELLETIGQGGFATVWKAWDGDGEQLVALKVLHGHHSEDRGKRERFFRGARKMAELSHPHIVRVLESQCSEDGSYFFVMEHVGGGNFEQAVLGGELTPEQRLVILLQVGEALELAHDRGVVHRDVKPSNILLDEKSAAKLTDFDLVRAPDTTGLTATRAMMGTVQFAAPEALESAAETGSAADVYSLGSTAVFAISGGRLPPWYYRDPARAISRLECGDELKRVLKHATEFDTQERFPSVGEYCRALEAAFTQEQGSRQSVTAARPALPIAEDRDGKAHVDLAERVQERGQPKSGDILLDGRFTLLEPIGQGGFSAVWKAADKKRNQFAAIKILLAQFAEDRTARERFLRGARKMQELTHPGIIRIITPPQFESESYFYAMEFLSGGNFRQLVLERRPSVGQVLDIIEQIARALAFAHDRGVIHRDVNPGNILLDTNGAPKLSDFDLVRAYDTMGGTRTGMLIGTFMYAAPEIFTAPAEAAEVADVFSLGMTAIFALYGSELPATVVRDTSHFVDALECSDQLKEALKRSVRWELESRFQSIREFADALREVRRQPTSDAGEYGESQGGVASGQEGNKQDAAPPDRFMKELIGPWLNESLLFILSSIGIVMLLFLASN